MVFYALKYTFDRVPNSLFFVAQLEPASAKCNLEMGGYVNEKHGVLDVVSLE